MGWDETTEESTGSMLDGGPTCESGLALAVLWCREEPWRVGELLVIGPGDRQPHIFGRGEDKPDEQVHPRLRLIQQRPGQNVVTPPLKCPKVSRVHLRIQRVDARTIAVENLGRRAVYARGREVQQVLLRVPSPGQTSEGAIVRIQGEMALLLVERDPSMAPLSHLPPAPTPGFGSPCAAGLVGESPVIWALRDELAHAAVEARPTLIHGGPGALLTEVALAAHRSGNRQRKVASIDLATIPRDAHQAALFGETGLLTSERDDVVLHALETLEPSAAELLGRTLVERFADRGDRPRLPTRVIASTTAPELLPEGLRQAFVRVVRAPSLHEQREDLPFIALSLVRTLAKRTRSGQGSADDELALSHSLSELLPQLPLDGGLPFLRAILARSLATSHGTELGVPPELEVIGAQAPSGNFRREKIPSEKPVALAKPAAPPESEYRPAMPLPNDLPPGVADGLPSLTRAERNVLRHLAGNKTSREIGQNLYISVRTVQNHRARICDKLGLRGNNALLGVALRLREHLGPPED